VGRYETKYEVYAGTAIGRPDCARNDVEDATMSRANGQELKTAAAECARSARGTNATCGETQSPAGTSSTVLRCVRLQRRVRRTASGSRLSRSAGRVRARVVR